MSTKNLSRLQNNEIHQLMVAYGLPSVPVTDSTRQILIPRLAAAITKNRRRSNDNQIQANEGRDGQEANQDEGQGADEMQEVRQEFRRFPACKRLHRYGDHCQVCNQAAQESPDDSCEPIPVVVEKIRGRRRRPDQVEPEQPGFFGSSVQNAFYLVLISIIAVSIYHTIFDL